MILIFTSRDTYDTAFYVVGLVLGRTFTHHDEKPRGRPVVDEDFSFLPTGLRDLRNSSTGFEGPSFIPSRPLLSTEVDVPTTRTFEDGSTESTLCLSKSETNSRNVRGKGVV